MTRKLGDNILKFCYIYGIFYENLFLSQLSKRKSLSIALRNTASNEMRERTNPCLEVKLFMHLKKNRRNA